MKNGQGNVKSLEITTDWQLREVISGCVLCHKTAFFCSLIYEGNQKDIKSSVEWSETEGREL